MTKSGRQIFPLDGFLNGNTLTDGSWPGVLTSGPANTILTIPTQLTLDFLYNRGKLVSVMRNAKHNDEFNDFDDQFTNITKTVNTGFKVIFVAWIVGAIASLSALAFVGWFLYHIAVKQGWL